MYTRYSTLRYLTRPNTSDMVYMVFRLIENRFHLNEAVSRVSEAYNFPYAKLLIAVTKERSKYIQ